MATVRKMKQPETLTEAVEAAVRAMTWLAPSDRAMVALALEYARQIDAAAGDAKAVGWLGQNLSGVLRALGGAPGERKALGVDERVRGKLAELRAARK